MHVTGRTGRSMRCCHSMPLWLSCPATVSGSASIPRDLLRSPAPMSPDSLHRRRRPHTDASASRMGGRSAHIRPHTTAAVCARWSPPFRAAGWLAWACLCTVASEVSRAKDRTNGVPERAGGDDRQRREAIERRSNDGRGWTRRCFKIGRSANLKRISVEPLCRSKPHI
jgi:hypothetical protein